MSARKLRSMHNTLDSACHINFSKDTDHYRMVEIIGTIGPSTRSVPKMVELIKAGMNIARINFSHERREDHELSIRVIREAIQICSKEAGYYIPIAIAADLKGREIRTGQLASRKPIELKRGDTFKLTINEGFANRGTKDAIFVDCPGMIKHVQVGQLICIDDNAISVIVDEVGVDCLICHILNEGILHSNVSVTVPGSAVDLPAVSEKDLSDIKFSLQHKVDFLFLSKLRAAYEVRQVRCLLPDNGINIRLFTKLENAEALGNLDDILNETDGVILARADLSIELNVCKIFLAQKAITARCNRVGKPIICATNLLMSMINSNVAKRSDIADIGNAILDGADCLLLSSETAIGLYPVEVVQTLERACREAEEAVWHQKLFKDLVDHNPAAYDGAHAVAISAVSTSVNISASAILVLTVSGRSAHLIAMYRPRCPIYAITRCSRVARQVRIARGVFPILLPPEIINPDERLIHAMSIANRRGVVKAGDAVVVVSPPRDKIGYSNNVHVIYAQFTKGTSECAPLEEK